MISIRMIKICDTSICRPLKLIFQSCLKSWKFQPISLLPIAGKIFERLLYDRKFEFYIENKLISKNQSEFRPGDSCINQFLSSIHEIYQSFDDSLDVRTVFLDIYNTFDKILTKMAYIQIKTKWYIRQDFEYYH